MKEICAMLLSASIFNSTLAVARQETATATAGKTTGPGIGANPGDLIGGPHGAAGGAVYGNHAGRKDDAIAALEKQLQGKNLAPPTRQNGFGTAKNRYAGTLHRVDLETPSRSLKKPGDGMFFPVYFSSNDAGINPETGQQIRKLASLVRDNPEIEVHLDAYANERGLPSYNLQLSRARALTVQKELIRAGLPFTRIFQHIHGEELVAAGCGDMNVLERRVDVQLALETQI